MAVFLLIALAVGALAMKFALPCPDPHPPQSLSGQISSNLNLIFFVCCGVYSLIPARTFQFWAFWLPLGLLIAILLVFTSAGEFRHAYFLSIHLVLVVMYTAVVNIVVSAMSAGVWIRVLVALLCAFVLPLFVLAQAIGFSQSLC